VDLRCKWLIFRGVRETGPQAMAVNEETGQIVQVTENGFSGMLCAGNKTMKLFVMSGVWQRPGPSRGARSRRKVQRGSGKGRRRTAGRGGRAAAPPEGRGAGGRGPSGPREILEIDLAKLFADVAAKTVKPAANYQRVCGTIPATLPADGKHGPGRQ